MREIISDIVREMRTVDYGIVENDFAKFADRIEKAYRRDLKAFGEWMLERHNLNVLQEEMERYVERELERDYEYD